MRRVIVAIWKFCSYLFIPRKEKKLPNDWNLKEFDKDFLGKLFEQATEKPRLRLNFDLRSSEADTSQRMLNALSLGPQVPIHRHENTTEAVICQTWYYCIMDKKENAEYHWYSAFFFVGIPGFEPGKAGPESAVLPLHHTPMP